MFHSYLQTPPGILMFSKDSEYILATSFFLAIASSVNTSVSVWLPVPWHSLFSKNSNCAWLLVWRLICFFTYFFSEDSAWYLPVTYGRSDYRATPIWPCNKKLCHKTSHAMHVVKMTSCTYNKIAQQSTKQKSQSGNKPLKSFVFIRLMHKLWMATNIHLSGHCS